MMVLIVEHDDAVREAFAVYLALHRILIETAGSGRQAIRKAITLPPDVIVLDLDLPEHDGLRTARQLRGNLHTQDIPIVALSRRTASRHRGQARTAGCGYYLEKPCYPQDLLSTIRRAPHDKML